MEERRGVPGIKGVEAQAITVGYCSERPQRWLTWNSVLGGGPTT